MHFKTEKDRYFEWYKKLAYAGPKSSRNIFTNLSPNPARPDLQLWFQQHTGTEKMRFIDTAVIVAQSSTSNNSVSKEKCYAFENCEETHLKNVCQKN